MASQEVSAEDPSHIVGGHFIQTTTCLSFRSEMTQKEKADSEMAEPDPQSPTWCWDENGASLVRNVENAGTRPLPGWALGSSQHPISMAPGKQDPNTRFPSAAKDLEHSSPCRDCLELQARNAISWPEEQEQELIETCPPLRSTCLLLPTAQGH